MGALDILRSFAESRSPDDSVIRDGITYGTARELTDELSRLRAENAALKAALAEAQKKYHELLFEVSHKFPNESRHETALRYIRQAEHQSCNTSQANQNFGG